MYSALTKSDEDKTPYFDCFNWNTKFFCNNESHLTGVCISVMSECKCFGERGNINSIYKKKLLESDEAPRALVFLESRK